jgi:hypothetical protein
MEPRYQILPPFSPEKRAAILEMDRGLLRSDAEQQALALRAERSG